MPTSVTMNRLSKKSILSFFWVFLTTFLLYLTFFGIVSVTKLNDQTLQSEDILPTSIIPFSILKEGNLDLNEYYDLMTVNYPNPDRSWDTPYYLKKIGDNYYSFFPQFTSFLVTPLYVIPALLNLDNNIEIIRIMSRIGGAFITALSAAIFWIALKRQNLSTKKRLLLFIIYAFGTNSLSTSSQGLWQHGASQLFLTLSLLFITNKNYRLLGLSLGFAFISRPTNLLPFVLIGVYTLLSTKKFKYTFQYGLFALIPILFELIIEISTYGSVFNSGYAQHTEHFTYNIWEGFLGMWFSPSKGILFCSPVLIFMFYSIFKAFKKIRFDNFDLYLTAIIVIHTFIMGSWYNWFGGYSWGYRMASDVIPYMVFLLIPFVNSTFFSKKFIKYFFLILTGYSILYHLSALLFFDTAWHIVYDGKSRYWLWSIENSQMSFSIKRVLYNLSLAENPIPIELIEK